MSNHAPGPWKIRRVSGTVSDEVIEIVAADGSIVADNKPYYPHALDEKNAPIIAAAPAMFAALALIASGTDDIVGPYRAFPRERMQQIARDILDDIRKAAP